MTTDKPTAEIHGAAKVLDITGEITPEIVRAAYKRAAMKYHPDRRPPEEQATATVMMQFVNKARDALLEFRGRLDHTPEAGQYGGELNEAIGALLACVGLDLEICGAWLWVTGETKSHKDSIKGFESESGNKFRWHSKKIAWYFAPNDYKGRRRFRGNANMDDIRDRYGSAHVATRPRTAIAG